MSFESLKYLPLKLAVRPVPVGGDGGGYVTAHGALGKQIEGGELLVIQKRVAVLLVSHRDGGEQLFAAFRARHTRPT